MGELGPAESLDSAGSLVLKSLDTGSSTTIDPSSLRLTFGGNKGEWEVAGIGYRRKVQDVVFKWGNPSPCATNSTFPCTPALAPHSPSQL